MTPARIAFLVGALLALPEAAAAECDVRLLSLSIADIAYNPFSTIEPSTTAEVTLRNDEPAPCPVTIEMSPADPTFTLTGAGATLLATFAPPGDPSAGGFRLQTSAPPGTSRIDFNIAAPTGQVRPPGPYSQFATATFVDETGAAALSVDQRVAPITAIVQAVAEVSFAPSSAAGAWTGSQSVTLDLGSLEPGDRSAAYIQVRANSDVRISLSSSTAAALQRSGASAGEPGVPFFATFDSVPIDIAAGTAEVTRSPAATLAGSVYVLDVSVGVVGPRYSGVYTGVIEVEVEAE